MKNCPITYSSGQAGMLHHPCHPARTLKAAASDEHLLLVPRLAHWVFPLEQAPRDHDPLYGFLLYSRAEFIGTLLHVFDGLTPLLNTSAGCYGIELFGVALNRWHDICVRDQGSLTCR